MSSLSLAMSMRSRLGEIVGLRPSPSKISPPASSYSEVKLLHHVLDSEEIKNAETPAGARRNQRRSPC